MAGRKGQSPARLARTRPRPRHHRPPPWPRGKAPRRHRRLRCRGPIAPPPSSRWPRTSSRSSWRSSSGPASPARLLQPHGARRVTKMSNRVANSILSGVLKVLGFITSTVVNSKPAQKFFKLMPGDVILASLDGFRKVWDAVEVSGKNVMQTSSSVVTTSVVTQRYGDQAGEITQDYLHATGNALQPPETLFEQERQHRTTTALWVSCSSTPQRRTSP